MFKTLLNLSKEALLKKNCWQNKEVDMENIPIAVHFSRNMLVLFRAPNPCTFGREATA